MNITWNVTDAEADFVLATLNGQPQNWTVMARAQLIQKLMEQSQQKAEQKLPQQIAPPPATDNLDLAPGGTDD